MITREFFQRDPVTCARELIGCELVWKSCAGIIVETEAYTEFGDEACHTFARPSARAFIAAHQPGAAYVYFNYGMYWLLNVLVKSGPGNGFVLIRALEPTAGIPLMHRRRFGSTGTAGTPKSAGTTARQKSQLRAANSKPRPIQALCSGPGKLTVALGVDGRDHGRDLCRTPQIGFRMPDHDQGLVPWVSDIRIGISKAVHHPWRFLAAEHTFVSVAHSSKRKRRNGAGE